MILSRKKHFIKSLGTLLEPLNNLTKQSILTSKYFYLQPKVNYSNTIYHINLQDKFIYKFSIESPQKTSLYLIKNACQNLIDYDAILFDQMCLIFGANYILDEKSKSQQSQIQNQKQIIKQIQLLLNKNNISNQAHKIFKNIKIIFQFLNGSKIGFLRGDLHMKTIFQLNKDLDQKIKKAELIQRRQQMQYKQQDFQQLLFKVTNPAQYRIPQKGIYKRQYQSKTNLYQRQILIEEVSASQAINKIEQILELLIKVNKIQQAQIIRKFIIDWLVPLTGAIQQQQKKCYSRELSQSRKIYGQYLLKINPEKLATIMLTQLIIQIFQTISRNGRIQNFHVQDYEGIETKKYLNSVFYKINIQMNYQKQQKLFRQCQREYDQLIKSQQKNYPRYQHKNDENNMDIQNQKTNSNTQKYAFWNSQKFIAKQKNLPYRYIKPVQRKEFLNNMVGKMSKFDRQFKQQMFDNVFQELGNLLIYLLKQLLKIENKYGYKVPLFFSQHKSIKKSEGNFVTKSIMRLNQHFLLTIIPKLQKSQDMFLHMEKSVPTMIQPLPWLQPQIGGYYSQATSVMRYSNCPIQQRLIKFADNHRVFNVLDYLSRTPWKINKDVLTIVQQIWNEGGDVSYIPKRYSQLMNTYISRLKIQKDTTKRKHISKKIQKLRDEFSLKSDFLLKLNIAQSFCKLDYFFFPHNLDFRGRVYPIPPHFNHIGHDLARGLLLFGVGKKLGKSGVKWLKIHTANLMGKDKASISDKLIFVEQNIDLIHKFAKDPLQHRQWLNYQDCWQAISSIIDLSRALKSPNPQEYISYLHIHQDGSCNGLQHYAALGRDLQGAQQVNLNPGDKPSDIYTHVSKMVIKMIQEDIQNQQVEENFRQLAKKLPDNIKRKTIKQTVMTSVYGVTFIGAREQIYRQLRDQDFLSEEETYQASLYIAKLTLKAISNLFTGANQIKKWFRTCANLVSKTGNPVGWISPLGLPIVQPYRKQSESELIKIVSHRIQVSKEIQNIPVNVMKQTSAFPPNFVHSLDSTHMMYTAEESQKRRLTFAAVHDSYWTHAGSVEQMNEILRQQFIKLHKQPLLENFKRSLESRFPELNFPQIPQRGTFNLEKVKQSLYFFS